MEEQFYERNIEVQTILSQKKKLFKKSLIKNSPIIRAHEHDKNKVLGVKVIGGDSEEVLTHAPPTIIVEKNEHDQISKIIVKCPCGRHAELVCEYD